MVLRGLPLDVMIGHLTLTKSYVTIKTHVRMGFKFLLTFVGKVRVQTRDWLSFHGFIYFFKKINCGVICAKLPGLSFHGYEN